MTDNYVCTLWLALFSCRGKNILNIVIIQRNEITRCYDYSNNSDITLPMM